MRENADNKIQSGIRPVPVNMDLSAKERFCAIDAKKATYGAPFFMLAKFKRQMKFTLEWKY